MKISNTNKWNTLDCFVKISSPWLTLIGEHLQDDRGKVIDYWRVEKADSVVILTIQSGNFLFPIPMYRPGLGENTLDFPGGRVPSGQKPVAIVPKILERELGITAAAIAHLTPLNTTGWAINSSFSNQKLYGFVAEIDSNVLISDQLLGAVYPTTELGISNLLQDLTCLQCRSVLLEWQYQSR
ncbi:MAG: NUDIX hydrolase [Microcoleaceae cyanobacterium MO_207.B10]|nr:NUDIX hydrolase [Microcoleaceae cyanobacterium MO_207.B10]